jgi:RNA polymerase sigma-70 factor (ECF subfamily)
MVHTTEGLHEQMLIVQCQAGDEEAFTTLVNRYHERLFYYVRRMLGSTDQTRDLLQDLWLEAFRGLPALKRPGSFKPWIYRIARNLACQRLRKTQRWTELTEDLSAPEPVDEERVFGPADAALIHRSLERIKPALREVLVLRFLEGMTYEQIAEVIGCPVGTIRSRIHYAKGALRREMEAHHDHGE